MRSVAGSAVSRLVGLSVDRCAGQVVMVGDDRCADVVMLVV